MWSLGEWDWAILGVGYVLALAVFYALAGFPGAAAALRSWGRSSSTARTSPGSFGEFGRVEQRSAHGSAGRS